MDIQTIILLVGFVALVGYILLGPTALDAIQQWLPEDPGFKALEVQEQLSKEIGGEFGRGEESGLFNVAAQVKEWTITLDSYTVRAATDYGTHKTYTRIRAPYRNKDMFTFMVCKTGLVTPLVRKVMFRIGVIFLGTKQVVKSLGIRVQGKEFALQDVKLGSSEFGADHIILSNHVHKARSLFTIARIRELIHAQPSINFHVRDAENRFAPCPPGYFCVLYFEERGVIKDVARLKSLFELFEETLNQLVAIGSASKEAPNVEL